MATRTIVHIDENLCDGCGECIPSCAEGALMIIGGVAKLVSDKYCDGMGSCLGVCPQGAITLEEREAAAFDEAAIDKAVNEKTSRMEGQAAVATPPPAVAPQAAPSCPGNHHQQFGRIQQDLNVPVMGFGESSPTTQPSLLTHWPVQLTLLHPSAPFLRNADLLLCADCVPFAYRSFHKDFLTDHAVAVACPKLDDGNRHKAKLASIFTNAGLKSITILRMEVPCCGGLSRLVAEALWETGVTLPVREIVISARGEKLNERELIRNG